MSKELRRVQSEPEQLEHNCLDLSQGVWPVRD